MNFKIRRQVIILYPSNSTSLANVAAIFSLSSSLLPNIAKTLPANPKITTKQAAKTIDNFRSALFDRVLLHCGSYSRPGGLALFSLPENQPSEASGKQSKRVTYGLMSRSGVPSRTSMPLTCKRLPSRPRSLTMERPMPLGLQGCRVAKIPCGVSSRKGRRTSFTSVALSK